MEQVVINKNMKLSEHFALGELTKTKYQTADGNIPSHVVIENLKRLCPWLEELRYSYNTLYCLTSIGLHFAVRPHGNRRKIEFLKA